MRRIRVSVSFRQFPSVPLTRPCPAATTTPGELFCDRALCHCVRLRAHLVCLVCEYVDLRALPNRSRIPSTSLPSCRLLSHTYDIHHSRINPTMLLIAMEICHSSDRIEISGGENKLSTMILSLLSSTIKMSRSWKKTKFRVANGHRIFADESSIARKRFFYRRK